MRALTEGDKIFIDVADSFEWSETKSIQEAYDLLKRLIDSTKGLLIVDFLDAGNWDYIKEIEIDKENNYLKLIWHNFKDSKETLQEKELREMVFPSTVDSLIIKFNELRILRTKYYPIFTLRGFVLKDKEIKSYLSKNTIEFEIYNDNDNFSKTAVFKTDSHFETCICLNTPIFSTLIIPKNSNLSAFNSKMILYEYNISDSILRLNNIINHFKNKTKLEEDIICEKANSIRRILEYILKVELCYRCRQLKVKKDYSDLMLGDLINLVKTYHDEIENDLLKQMAIISNELSHDSGKPIILGKAISLNMMAIAYAQILKLEIRILPHPHIDDRLK